MAAGCPCVCWVAAASGSCLFPASAPAPVGLIFAGAYPNPFNPQTTFTFSLPVAGEVTLEIFQSTGRQVATVIDEEALRAGGHRVTWVAQDEAGVPLASGIYLAPSQFEAAFVSAAHTAKDLEMALSQTESAFKKLTK